MIGAISGVLFGGFIAMNVLPRFATYSTKIRGTFRLVRFQHSESGEEVFLEHHEGARIPPFWRFRYEARNGVLSDSVPCLHCHLRYNDDMVARVTIYDREIESRWRPYILFLGIDDESCVFVIPRGVAPCAESKSSGVRDLGAVNT